MRPLWQALLVSATKHTRQNENWDERRGLALTIVSYERQYPRELEPSGRSRRTVFPQAPRRSEKRYVLRVIGYGRGAVVLR